MEGLRQRKREKDESDSNKKDKEITNDGQYCLPTYAAYVIIFTFFTLSVIICRDINERLPTGLKIADEAVYPDR